MSEDKRIPISPEALEAFTMGSVSGTPTSPQAAPQRIAAPPEDEQDERFPLVVLPGFCTRLSGSTCERCTFVCPYDAISFDEAGAPLIDAAYCTRCGLCCGICDAFVTERITLNDLLEKVRRLSADDEPVFFACYDQVPQDFAVHPNVIMLPCIGAVAPEFWAAALEVTPHLHIYCNFALCKNCPTAGDDARSFFTHAINLGEQWSRIHMGRADRLPEKTDILTRFFDATDDEFQRRGVATSLFGEMKDITSGKYRKRNSDTLAKHHARTERLHAKGHVTNARHHCHMSSTVERPIKKTWPRLRMIAKTVQEHPDIATHIPRYFAAVDESLCKQCYEPCFSHCPAGARSVDSEGTIQINPLLCIACGNCALHCPTDAAYLFETDASLFLNQEQTSD